MTTELYDVSPDALAEFNEYIDQLDRERIPFRDSDAIVLKAQLVALDATYAALDDEDEDGICRNETTGFTAEDVATCELPADHEGRHKDGSISWSTDEDERDV